MAFSISLGYLCYHLWVGAVERALAFHQCGPDSIPGPDVIRGLSFISAWGGGGQDCGGGVMLFWEAK